MNAPRVLTSTLAVAAAGAMLMALAAIPKAGGTISYNGSLQMARGTYIFTVPTQGYFFFNGLTFSSRTFSLSATVPLIYQTTPYVSYTGVGVLFGRNGELSRQPETGREPVLVPRSPRAPNTA
jgi:hypothetical protein